MSVSIWHEAKAIIRLAWPIVIVNLCMRAIDVTDAMMAGRNSSNDLAAVSLALSIWEPLFLFCLGCLYAITPITTQCLGKNQGDRSGNIVQHGMLFALLLSLLVVLMLNQMHRLGTLLAITPDLLAQTGRYLFFLSFGVPALLNCLVLRNLCESWSYLKPVAYINVIGVIVNIPLNYLFINGILVPELGGVSVALLPQQSPGGVC